MKAEVTALPAEIQEMSKGVSTEKSNEVQNVLNKVFNGVSKMREQLDSIVVEDENDKYSMNLARTTRLAVRDERLDSEKLIDAKRSEVQQRMSADKAEDSLWLKTKQVMQILTKEIEANAKWKEETAKRFEAEKFELEMQERLNRVIKFNDEITLHDVRQHNDDNFELFLSGIEKSYNDKIEAERLEAERIENERIDKEKAIEAQRLENIRLNKLAEQKEAQLLKERKEAKDKADAIEAKAKLEREKLLKETKEREKQQAIKEAKIKAENDAKLKDEQQAKAKLEAELKESKFQSRKQILLNMGFEYIEPFGDNYNFILKGVWSSFHEQIENATDKGFEETLSQINDAIKKSELKKQKEDAKAPAKEKISLWVDGILIKPIGTEKMNEDQREVCNDIMRKFEAFKKWAKTQVTNL
jgi:hypothetical protein